MDLKRELKTKSQHFVPCSYLYGFAAQKNIEKPRESRIYRYPLKTKEPSLVTLKSQCSKPLLYELYDDKDYIPDNPLDWFNRYLPHDKKDIIYPNLLEDYFNCEFERHYHKYVESIQKKALYCNIGCRYFLTNNEKEFWKRWISIQLMRYPECFTVLGPILTSMHARVSVEMICDFFKNKLSSFADVNFAVWWDESNRIITCDRPASIITKSGDVVFPISSSFYISLIHDIYVCEYENGYSHSKNTFFNDVEKNRKDMFECVVKAADSAIYSNHILSNKELKWMTNVLREKKDV